MYLVSQTESETGSDICNLLRLVQEHRIHDTMLWTDKSRARCWYLCTSISLVEKNNKEEVIIHDHPTFKSIYGTVVLCKLHFGSITMEKKKNWYLVRNPNYNSGKRILLSSFPQQLSSNPLDLGLLLHPFLLHINTFFYYLITTSTCANQWAVFT